jgi:predicted TIM-barrel fold metal-dependent hydrolase
MEKKMENNQVQEIDRQTFLKVGSALSLGVAATFSAPSVISAQSETKAGKKDFGEKIDIFCHVMPQKYKEALLKKTFKPSYYLDNVKGLPALSDLDIRFKAMDKYVGYRQVLSIGVPPVELVLSPKDAADLSRMGNDEMAELVNKYPDRFVAALAGLPMNDVDASIREIERTIKELKFKGVQIYSSVNRKPLDRPEFLGIYEKLSQYDVPLFLHPVRDRDVPDYPDEKLAKYSTYIQFGWPYETTMAMSRLVLSGIMEKYPNLKVVVHHCGAMLPFFAKRAALGVPEPGEVMNLTKPPLEYYKKFYGDTVLGGNTPALMCGHAFFGTDHMVFASDYPYPGGVARADVALGEVIKSVEDMNISDEEKVKIFSKNTRQLLKLS